MKSNNGNDKLIKENAVLKLSLAVSEKLLHASQRAAANCFCCGLPVCANCSTKRKYYKYGKVRLCNRCQIEYDGNDKIVMARLLKACGY